MNKIFVCVLNSESMNFFVMKLIHTKTLPAPKIMVEFQREVFQSKSRSMFTCVFHQHLLSRYFGVAYL